MSNQGDTDWNWIHLYLHHKIHLLTIIVKLGFSKDLGINMFPQL